MNDQGQAVTLPDALQLAIRFHQNGELQNAEAVYRQILQAEPNNADALHLLGLVAHQMGEGTAAVDLIEKAIRVKPTEPLFHNNLGIAYHALHNLKEAIACFQRVLSFKPDHYETLYYLATALKEQGKAEEAIACYQRILFFKPDHYEVLYCLGNASKERGDTEEAIACYRRALSFKPDYHAAHINLGNALQERGDTEEAIACYRRALSFNPDQHEALYNLGNALYEQGDTEEAIACYRSALSSKSDYHPAHINLGNALKEGGDLEEAIASYRRALTFNPDHYETLYNLGNALLERANVEEAIACYQRALVFRPDYHMIHYNLGSAFLEQGRLEEAIASYRYALSLKADFHEAHSGLLFALQYLPGIDAHTLKQAHEDFEKNYAAQFAACLQPHRNMRDPQRPLRTGFVSGDLRRHPVSYFLVRLLENLDPARMKIICYTNSPVEDDMTARIKTKAKLWRNVTGLSDDALAQLIRNDGIDVLFDLSGHTAGNRLLVFAMKPAPVQISWIGYASTTGLSAIDYLMSDNVCIPVGEEKDYTERAIRLPNSFLCYDPPSYAPDIESLPALRNGFVTFGSFNNLTKVNGEVIGVWSEILKSLREARLLLKSKLFHYEKMRNKYAALFESNEIDPHRVDLLPSSSHSDYLAAYHKIDIALDPFPFSGGTTSCEALWMGVPVVTLYGQTALGRQGASLNVHTGLSRLIAKTKKDYCEIAVRLTADLEGLSDLRSCLRSMMEKSPLCDGQRFAGDWTQVVTAVWRTWSEMQE
ncbi:MAG: tetratricopeptide repeat protein [Thermodesulfovibrionales bacterium]|jgi:predicted O-linked N-acetylglucosamine transferase (SPINDLY family)